MKNKDGGKGKEVIFVQYLIRNLYTSEQGYETTQNMKTSVAINNGRLAEFIQKKSILINYWVMEKTKLGF